MGVRGFDLLDQCGKKRLPAAMLTAHAISVESVNRALNLGAISFLPKEELVNLGNTWLTSSKAWQKEEAIGRSYLTAWGLSSETASVSRGRLLKSRQTPLTCTDCRVR